MAKFAYNKGPSAGRREWARRTSSSVDSRTLSERSSTRTACPKDENAFTYKLAHLKFWYLDDALWNRLPAPLQAALTAVQHAGAAALTGFERLEDHTKGFDVNRDDRKVSMTEFLVGLEDMPPRIFRTSSNASSVLLSEVSSPPSAGSSASESGTTSPINSYFHLPHPKPTASPASLVEPSLSAKTGLPRERSFSTPLQPIDAYYDVELSHLRTEALPRLRHKCHKVDTAWYENKGSAALGQEDLGIFENWWAEKKCKILELQEYVKRLADERNLAPTGMGWCAP